MEKVLDVCVCESFSILTAISLRVKSYVHVGESLFGIVGAGRSFISTYFLVHSFSWDFKIMGSVK